MPFTPYHFGPCACIALPLNKHIDIPVFILANVIVDLEPLAVILLGLNYPLHGFCHTFLVGTALGLGWGLLAYAARGFFKWLMQLFRLPYQTNIGKMALSGILGIWLHILLDANLYNEMRPFWPIAGNHLYKMISYSVLYSICEISCIAAVVIYPAWVYSLYRKRKAEIRTGKINPSE